jgi:zeta-carotene isomerase
VWIAPGQGLADDYLTAIESAVANPEVVIVAILGIFGVVHSGLAYLRPYGAALGKRDPAPRPSITPVYHPCSSGA